MIPLSVPAALGRYVKIGEGVYSEVFRRAGSAWVIQVIRPERHELDLATLRGEEAYLRDVFANMPGLIPAQRLIPTPPGAPRGTAGVVLAKRFVPVDGHRNLRTATAHQLGPRLVRQLDQFVGIVRELLADPSGNPLPGTPFSAVPDIIDPPLTNLAVDVDGNLRLLDTNRLIGSKALAHCLATDQTLDLKRRRIHAMLLRRLMFLEARYLGRDRASLRGDPLYRGYLTVRDLATLFAQAAELCEPIEPGVR